MASLPRRPLIWAHRGASAVAPENTLAAFAAARDAGADGIELDVTRCATGEVVVLHDATVDRTTDGHGRARDLTLDALRGLDAGHWFGPAFAGQQVPLLDEVLELVGQRLLVNIEIKPEGSGGGLEQRVAAMVRAHGLATSVLISSFSPGALGRMGRADAALPRAVLYAKAWPPALIAGASAGILRARALHPHYRLVDCRLVAQAHRRGLTVNAWTADEPETWRRLKDLGVDGIITNRPAELLALID